MIIFTIILYSEPILLLGPDLAPLNPLTTARRLTVTHLRRFLTVLKYSPIGVKFSPTTATRTLYTVNKKSKFFKTLFEGFYIRK
jgi:hypothetical protein